MRSALVYLFAGAVFLSSLAGQGANDPERLYGQAQQGDVVAQFKLGNEFFFGRNRKVNLILAVYWFRKSADGGYSQAQYNLARCYERGWGCRKSPGMAVKYYKLAMEQNLPEATLRYAELLYRGVRAEDGAYGKLPGLKADKVLALNLMRLESRKSAAGKIILAKHLFFDAPRYGRELRAVLEECVNLPNPHPEMLLLYSSCLRTGIGGDADVAKGVKMLQRAADAGNLEALAQLGEVLELGLGLPMNAKKAMEYTRRAADGGNQRALVNLGNAYLAGIYVEYDPAAAIECFRKAAVSGYPPALRRVGDCYFYGMGVEKDLEKAFENYRSAAVGGDEEARCLVGMCYANGHGVRKNDAEAFFWFTQAAEAGSIKGMRKMAIALLDGRGVRKDRAKGLELLRRAAAAGDEAAKHLLESAGGI